MKYFTFGHRLPRFIRNPLFGDRDQFGLEVNPEDPDWIKWQHEIYQHFYNTNQRRSVGSVVNDAGYEIMTHIDLSGMSVLEVGPGDIRHTMHWKGTPERYVIADIQSKMLDRAAIKLQELGIVAERRLVARDEKGTLPFSGNEFDIIVSFYSLEHLYPFESYLAGMLRVLKPGGLLVGAIPNEGGLAWGFGRYLTSRRWFKKNTSVNPDKIICWEHPNYSDYLLSTLDHHMERRHQSFWPLRLPSMDLNLVTRFIYAKR